MKASCTPSQKIKTTSFETGKKVRAQRDSLQNCSIDKTRVRPPLLATARAGESEFTTSPLKQSNSECKMDNS